MQGLQRTLRTLSLSGVKGPPINCKENLLDQRIFYIAPKETIDEVAAILTEYIFDGPHRGKDGLYDRISWDTLKKRVSAVINVLFNDEQYLRVEFSRTLACIAYEVRNRIVQEDSQLGAVFISGLANSAMSRFEGVWKNVNGGYVDPHQIQQLESHTAILADLHARSIGGLDLARALGSILPKATTPDLFNLILFTFVSRGLAGSGIKLSPSSWRQIVAQFDRIPESWWGPSYDSIWTAIATFEEDARDIRCECGVPYREVQDFQDWELRELCEAIRRKVECDVDGEEDRFGMDMYR